MSGFSIVPNWLIRDSDLTARELLVYIALLNRADKFGVAWPSMTTLSQEARSDKRTVREALKSLERRGFVTTQRRPQHGGRHKPNLYQVAIFDHRIAERGGGVHERTPVGSNSVPEWDARTQQEVDPREVDPDEVDVRSALQAEQTRRGVSIPEAAHGASREQRDYIKDLWIHRHGAEPTAADIERFSGLSSADATELIGTLLRGMPRHDAYEGPEPGDPAYAALSERGREWSDRGMLPESEGAFR